MGARDVGVVIVAAGQGTRLGADLPKQYRPLGGIPLVRWAVRTFLDHPDVAHVALVLPAGDAAAPPVTVAPGSDTDERERLTIVAGADTRAGSVRAGLKALPAHCLIVLVHDGARPFPDRDVIEAVMAAARRGEGALAAIPVHDTLKAAEPADATRVARTVSRDGLWRAQTPQGFPRELLERAHAEALLLGQSGTDDAELVEAIGGTVRLIPDSPRNLKVTTPDDMRLAELLARERPAASRSAP